MILLILFILVPLAEVWLLIEIGQRVGFWPTVGLVVGMGLIGSWLAKYEGLRVVRSTQRALAEGRVPEEGVIAGLLVLLGGVLLVTPGVLTDAVGLVLLFPPTRRLVAAGVMRWLARKVREGRVTVVRFGEPMDPRLDDQGRDIIDVDPDEPAPRS